jgi:hypothetical protein
MTMQTVTAEHEFGAILAHDARPWTGDEYDAAKALAPHCHIVRRIDHSVDVLRGFADTAAKIARAGELQAFEIQRIETKLRSWQPSTRCQRRPH